MARSWDEDESLPLFFILRALACVIIPWTAVLLRQFKTSKRHPPLSTLASAEESNEKSLSRKSVKASKGTNALIQATSQQHSWTVGGFFRMVLLAALWVWFICLVRQYQTAMAQNALYEGFDPRALLRVDANTKGSDLSKAYRREAIKYHPDKNSSPEAIEKFLLVRKAFDSLTDPEAMNNFKTFGNPDGPQYVQLFAIPSFIKDKEASRANGKLTYTNRYFRAADLQMQMLGVVFAVLITVFMLTLDLSKYIGD